MVFNDNHSGVRLVSIPNTTPIEEEENMINNAIGEIIDIHEDDTTDVTIDDVRLYSGNAESHVVIITYSKSELIPMPYSYDD